MANLYGAKEVKRQQQRLTATFTLLDDKDIDLEAQAHYARYLCIRLSGFAEQSLKDLVSNYARSRSSAPVHRYVDNKLRGVWGINKTKLKETLDAFEPAWFDELICHHPDEVEALNSVGKLRDNIAHGGDSGIGMTQAIEYRDKIFSLFTRLCLLLDPPNGADQSTS